jgi:anti-sigma regulatory factor (Ser/Thr protein kinase)
MTASIRDRILLKLQQHGVVRAAEIVKDSGLSRAYVHRSFNALEREGLIIRLGKANRARYLAAARGALQRARRSELTFRRMLRGTGTSEDEVLADIRRETGVFLGLPGTVSDILEYSFSEMLNNALEHSRAKRIDVHMTRTPSGVSFRVRDYGVGILRNIMRKNKLKSESEAVQDLMKGKQTTQPDRHSGEGIFFTSRLVDLLIIRGSNKKLIFDNRLGDVFVREVKPLIGTQIDVMLARSSKRTLRNVFDRYAGRNYTFDKTSLTVRLFAEAGGYVSRSQARRLVAGLEKFRSIVLDFSGLKLVGQSFADEIFSVWQAAHPDITIEVLGSSEDVNLMIDRARHRRDHGG